MTENGTVNLTRLKTLPCLCSMCTKYSLKEIKEADSLEREKILGLHNLYVLQKIMDSFVSLSMRVFLSLIHI
mgnify:CR=1 FL=1